MIVFQFGELANKLEFSANTCLIITKKTIFLTAYTFRCPSGLYLYS